MFYVVCGDPGSIFSLGWVFTLVIW